ncbi:MAG TPA: DUF222 domain-containing protein [Streptosporangiaceae bacterium]
MSTSAAVELEHGDDLPEDWTRIAPGPGLAARLASLDWPSLSDWELVAAMDAARRQATWAQALMLEGVAALSCRRRVEDPTVGSERHRRICGEVSLELTVTPGQAEELVFLADTLPGRLPRTWAALRGGRIDYQRARVMADGLDPLDDDLASRLDTELIDAAEQDTTTTLRRRLSRAVRRADPAAAVQRTKRARDERRVEVWANSDDTCDLVGRNLDAVEAHAIHARLSAVAHAMRADGDVRPVDHIRLDLFRDLLRGIPMPEAARHLFADQPDTGGAGDTAPAGSHAHDGSSPSEGAADPIAEIERQIAAALAETADAQLTGLLERARAEGRLDGLTHMIREATQAMRQALAPLVDAWCRAVGQPGTGVGERAPHGHDGYRPPAALQRLIQRRHTTCVYPRCHRPSTRCDIDHTQPYDKGGRTCRCNTSPLCRAHHRVFKQHPQWTLVQPWPGLLIWIAPAGTWHIVLPQ